MSVVLSLLFYLSLIFLSGLWTLFLPGPSLKDNPSFRICISWLAGLQSLYLLTLILPQTQQVQWGMVTLALIGVWCFYNKMGELSAIRFSCNRWDTLCMIALCILILPLLFEPVVDWDSRSIWFFHGKIIFFDGGLHAETQLASPAYWWSHPNYPKLSPSLIAYFASAAGFWNEFVTKFAPLALFLTNVALLFTISPSGPLRFLLLLVFFGFGREQIWNGYLDFYLAVFGSVGVCFLGQWFRESKKEALVLALFALGLALNLKDEGLAWILCVGLGSLFLYPFQTFRTLKEKYFWLVVSLPLFNFTTWWFLKKTWGIKGYFDFGSSMLERIQQRALEIESLNLIAYKMLSRSAYGLLFLVGVLLLLRFYYRKPIKVSNPLLLATFCFYTSILVLIYLGTPFNLYSHISTSVERVILPGNLLLILFAIQTFNKSVKDDLCLQVP